MEPIQLLLIFFSAREIKGGCIVSRKMKKELITECYPLTTNPSQLTSRLENGKKKKDPEGKVQTSWGGCCRRRVGQIQAPADFISVRKERRSRCPGRSLLVNVQKWVCAPPPEDEPWSTQCSPATLIIGLPLPNLWRRAR